MSINYLEVGASAACGWRDEQYHYNMQEFAEWYRELAKLGELNRQIVSSAFIELMGDCQVKPDYTYAIGNEKSYVWDFNSETVVIASTLAGPLQVIPYHIWCDWYNSMPAIVEKVCNTCKHVEVKSGLEPCYSCDSLVGDEFNWEPQEDDE